MTLPFSRFRLLPRNVVFLAEDGSRRYFRIAILWDGSLRLRERTAPQRGRGALLVLAAAIPLRRLFRVPRRHRGTRNLLLATAAEAFPFDVDEGLFALGERDAKSYIFALDRVRFEALEHDVTGPAAVLVASSGEQSDVLAAVIAWLREGPVRDMLAGPRPLRPSTLLLAGQACVLLGLAWFMLDSWNTRNEILAHTQQQLLQRTREEAEPLLRKRQSVFRMVEADRALVHLQQLPAAEVATRLGSVIGDLPEGTRIDRIQLAGEQLIISGWGQDPKLWLRDTTRASLENKEYPKEDRFKLTFELRR